jgi:MFS family permease
MTLTRDAKLLLLASIISNVGNGIYTLAVGKLLYDQTGSALSFGIVIAFEYLMIFLSNFLAGPIVDRYANSRMLTLVDGCRAAFILALCLLIQDELPLVLVTLISFVIFIGKPFYRAAFFSIEPLVVPSEQLGKYHGFASSAFQTGQFIGIVLAGVLLTYFDPLLCLVLNGVSFAFSALIFCSISQVGETNCEVAQSQHWDNRLIADWRDAVKTLNSVPGLTLTIFASVGDYVLPSMINALLVVFVAQYFNGEAAALSLLDGAFALGALSAGLLAGHVVDRLGRSRSAGMGLFGQGLGFASIAFMAIPSNIVGMMFAIGAFNTISYTSLITHLQQNTDKSIRGRVSLFRNLFAVCVAGVTIPLLTYLSQSSLSWALLFAALVSCIFAVIAVLAVKKWNVELSYQI